MLEKFYQFAAPLGTPFPTALTVAGVVFADTQQTLPAYLALLAAIAAFFGFEAVGGLSTYAFVRMLRTRESQFVLFAGFFGLIIYFLAGVMLLHGYAVSWFLPLTPFAYIAWASVRDLNRAEQELDATRTSEVTLLQEKRRLINAETRQIKAGNATETPKSAIVAPGGVSLKTQARMLYDNDPDLPAIHIAAQIGAPPRTVQRWVKEWKGNKEQ